MAGKTFILGGGVTGLAVGYVSGNTIFEAFPNGGGICSSYYLGRQSHERTFIRTSKEEDYRFEIGGGHWIFGGDPAVLAFLRSLAPMDTHQRSSAVFFPNQGWMVPYPIQNHLSYLPDLIADKALQEIKTSLKKSSITLEEWLRNNFGETLFGLFFAPFHKLYTAGIWEEIAPQDDYKSPIDIKNVEAGRTSKANPVGYNVTYLYPHNGLGDLFRILANHCSIKYEKRVVSIDIRNKKLEFSDGSKEIYDRLMATLPLNQLLEFSNLKTKSKNDPYTSVLVFNIGAVKGKNCPKEHWLYIPESRAGFHRVGFYSNVDSSFLPKSARADSSLVSIYVEKAYKGGLKPTEEEIQRLCKEVVQELQQWQFINEDEIVDPTWVEVAYTWAYPQSRWRQEAMSLLQEQDIFPVGRYARWIFQGIADSIRDGFIVGSSFKSST